MFESIKSAFKVATNLDNIKKVAQSVYNVVTKVLSAASYIKTQLTPDTQFGKVVADHLPLIIASLEKVAEVFVKFGPLVGVVLNQVSAQDVVDPKKDLSDALAELAELTK